MATEKYKIAIVGSGPAGLSAAGRAAEKGISHVLLEAAEHYSNTIFRYQKGKHIMAEPMVLPLRSPLPFDAGTRENILIGWIKGAKALEINARYHAEVSAISKQPGGEFNIETKAGDTIIAEKVVLSIGLQGNLRTLGVDGEDLPFVQYQLDDPKEYQGEVIVVVGAGDAAIENAIALARHNMVIIVNRRDEFNRAKEGNLNSILQAINKNELECLYSASPARVEAHDPQENHGKPGMLVLKMPEGESQLRCDRIIGRLGAIPARKFVESCGIHFPNDDPASVPAVSAKYESNVPGLYIIGALAGYPLIKQAMNQGYEVIEYIEGNNVEPADEPLLKSKFASVPEVATVDDALSLIKYNIPLFSDLTMLQLREFMLDSEIMVAEPDQPIFRYNDYSDSFYSVLRGEVRVQVDPDDPRVTIAIRAGQFFGEMSLISGRRRSATIIAGKTCVLVETPRRSMNKLINSVESVKRRIDETFLLRAIQQHIAPNIKSADLVGLVSSASIKSFATNDVLFKEGDPGDDLYLIRSGSVTVSRELADHEVVLAYLPAGNYVGEMALLSGAPRSATVRAAVPTEVIRLGGTEFMELLDQSPEIRRSVEEQFQERLHQNVQMQDQPEAGDVVSFLIGQGLGEATDVLLIDESLCVRCDFCERACAETHDGASRLNREAGPTFASVHVPTSCRHCEHPHCMADCPPDAIHRAPNGEVFIADNCIGCGNCERNCPYGVIQMAETAPKEIKFWASLLRGKVVEKSDGNKKEAVKKAIKCDMCKDLEGGPACVRSCPTGAALRVKPEEFLSMSRE
jgi:CRP-like cAMP-binding protein/thioredoxin reductase/Pyruvate/2-oxoacid:ferredoxin oxidoreductase delta subunit